MDCLYRFLKEHLFYVCQERNNSKSSISYFQDIYGPTYQEPKDVDYIKHFHLHVFWLYQGRLVHKILMYVF